MPPSDFFFPFFFPPPPGPPSLIDFDWSSLYCYHKDCPLTRFYPFASHFSHQRLWFFLSSSFFSPFMPLLLCVKSFSPPALFPSFFFSLLWFYNINSLFFCHAIYSYLSFALAAWSFPVCLSFPLLPFPSGVPGKLVFFLAFFFHLWWICVWSA